MWCWRMMRGRRRKQPSSLHNHRALHLVLLASTILFTGRVSLADDLKRLSADVFLSSEAEIARIEGEVDADAATDEIAAAKRLIENGNLLLRAGHSKKAARYAEQLQLQLDLIKALIAARAYERAARAAEGELLALEDELRVLKDRYQEMLRLRHGDENRDAPKRGE